MSGYYDHHATLQLDRPLAIGGIIGTPYRQTAYHVSSRTGLPFSDLDRLIEHEAGQSLWDLVHEHGEAAMREIESELLRRALRARPAGVLALGDGTLLDEQSRAAVAEQATLAFLELDLAGAYWVIRRHEEANGRFWNPFLPSPIVDIEQLRPIYDRLAPGLRQAEWTIPAAGRHPSQLALEIIRRLESPSRGEG